VNRQIGVEESKYRVTGDTPFTAREVVTTKTLTNCIFMRQLWTDQRN